MIDLHDYSLATIAIMGLVVVLAASEIGCRLGTRARLRGGHSATTLESAVLGLLALIIGFTFAMALSRFEGRRDAILVEANAIGTTALRARLLPEPHRSETLKLLKEYVAIRLDITQRPAGRTELAAAVDRSNAIQESLWQQVRTLALKDPSMVPTGLFIQTLNEMIDDQAKRLAAVRHRVPDIVVVLLFGIAAVAVGFSGYSTGFDPHRSRVPMYIVGVLVSAVIVLILDLDRPGVGFIQVSQQPMIDAAASLASFKD